MSDIGVAVQEEAVGIHARHVLVLSQAMFFCCLVACFLIDHGAAAQNDGISFYGVYAPTILILVVGFTCAAVGLWRTASYFARTGVQRGRTPRARARSRRALGDTL